MKISDEIIQMIKKATFAVAPVTETPHLYTELGYDSLAFVHLLLEDQKHREKIAVIEDDRT